MITVNTFENFSEFAALDIEDKTIICSIFNMIIDVWTYTSNLRNQTYFWKSGRKQKTTEELVKHLIDDNWNYTYPDTLKNLKFVESHYESFNNMLRSQDGFSATGRDEFEKAFYENLVKDGWSKVDDNAWKDIKYTFFEGNTLIVAPTGNGREYKVIGQDAREVYLGLVALDKLKYISNVVIKKLNESIFGKKIVMIDDLNGNILPGSISQSLYRPKPVWSDNGGFLGMSLSTPTGSKITVLDYIQKSMEQFLTNPDNQIEIKNVISNDSNEPTFRYINLDIKSGNCETWENWMNDTFDKPEITKDLFKAWIGSVVVADNNSKQILYIHGEGNNGKSQVINALSKYLGNAATALDKNSMSNQFGFAKIENKRLVTISDNKNPELLKTGYVHKITGGDFVDIERKGKNSYSAKLFAKILVAENIAPNIDADEINQVTRLIYIKCRKKTEEECVRIGIGKYDENGEYVFLGNSEFPKKLIEETEAFIHECLKVYKEKCPTNSMIAIPKSYIENVIKPSCGDITSYFDIDILEETFEKGSDDDYISTKDFWDYVEEAYKGKFNRANSRQLQNINKIVTNIFQTEAIQKRINGKKIRVYKNLKLKNKNIQTNIQDEKDFINILENKNTKFLDID